MKSLIFFSKLTKNYQSSSDRSRSFAQAIVNHGLCSRHFAQLLVNVSNCFFFFFSVGWGRSQFLVQIFNDVFQFFNLVLELSSFAVEGIEIFKLFLQICVFGGQIVNDLGINVKLLVKNSNIFSWKRNSLSIDKHSVWPIFGIRLLAFRFGGVCLCFCLVILCFLQLNLMLFPKVDEPEIKFLLFWRNFVVYILMIVIFQNECDLLRIWLFHTIFRDFQRYV